MAQLLILLAVLVFVIFPIWVIIRVVALGRENNALAEKLIHLEAQLDSMRALLSRPGQSTRVPSEAAPSTPPAAPHAVAAISREPAASGTVGGVPSPRDLSGPPPVPDKGPTPAPVVSAASQSVPDQATAPTPPPRPTPVVRPAAPPPPSLATESPVEPPPVSPRRSINWEQFTGAKLLAWLGGVAAFLAAAFFIKYSFEHDLIPPEVRVAIGFVFAIGLVVAGLKIPRERYAVTAQTLIATGIVSLYAVTFACNSIYHFAFFGPTATFLLMSLITVTAFLLAVRLDARVIAVLGILGGFVTPVLLSTGHDNPPGLFGYLALLDVGLIAVALHRRWHFLVPLGALGTAAMEIGWAVHFLSAAKAPTAMVVTLAFSVLFFGAYMLARQRQQRSQETVGSAIAMPFVAFGFALAFLDYATIASRPGLLFSFVLAADAVLLAIAWFDERAVRTHLVAGMTVFALLAIWTGRSLTPALLGWALTFYLLYAAIHTAFPLLLQRRRPEATPPWWSQLFTPLALLLMLGPVLKLDSVSLALWPCVLLVDALAIGVAFLTASLVAVALVLVITLGAAALWMLHTPIAVTSLAELLVVVGGFAVLFFAATGFLGWRLARNLDGGEPQRGEAVLGSPLAQLPAMSALLPFVLLIMMTERLSLANPSPVFGLALLLCVLVLGLSGIMAIEWLPACALGGVAALEYAWHARHFAVPSATTPLAWYLVFTALFAVFPFVLRRRLAALTGPWAVAALAGAVHFPLVYELIRHTWPNSVMGLLPAAFALAPLASLLAVLRLSPASERARLNQLAWFGGVTLLFITLIFPIQFSRQWLTLGWALEGAALLWLFHRVPHPGLRTTGVVLLVAAFARLALNPAVLEYHARSTTPLLNWYLYSYGLVIAALFVGARLLAPPRDNVLGITAPPLLNTLGTVLAFLLLNLEIADYFSAPGTSVLTFQFSGNFARDMSYTIAWALFALGLLLVCIWKQVRAGRFAALGLLAVAVAKLFFHDLARLDALYRVGALLAVAVVAIVASVAYQRFLPGNDSTDQP